MFYAGPTLRHALQALAFAAVLGAGTPAMAAMSVSPLIINVEGQPGKQGELKVVNDGTDPLNLEIAVTKLQWGGNNEFVEVPAGDDVIVVPPLRTVAPGATQLFRFQYIGEPLSVGQSYYVSIRQLPIKQEGGTAVQFLYNFRIVANVFPPGGQVALTATSASVGRGKDGKPAVDFTVQNGGTQQAMLQDIGIRFLMRDGAGSTTWQQEMLPADIASSIGVGLILPGTQRRFSAPVSPPAGGGTLSVEFFNAPAP